MCSHGCDLQRNRSCMSWPAVSVCMLLQRPAGTAHDTMRLVNGSWQRSLDTPRCGAPAAMPGAAGRCRPRYKGICPAHNNVVCLGNHVVAFGGSTPVVTHAGRSLCNLQLHGSDTAWPKQPGSSCRHLLQCSSCQQRRLTSRSGCNHGYCAHHTCSWAVREASTAWEQVQAHVQHCQTLQKTHPG